MKNQPRHRLHLTLGLTCATLFASACSVHDSERSLDPSTLSQPVVQPTTPEDVQAAMERQQREAAKAAAETDDLWERTRLTFSFTDALDHERVQPYIEHYRDNPRIIEYSTRRAEPFAYFILSEIEARGMPSELLLLPIVESGFAASATSHARAAGVWQFIPATGDHFGLTRDHWYDGRRDVYKSTLAALDYLEALHRQFDDWYLALAAYNFGRGNVARAIRRNEDRGLPTDYWNLELSAEASAYVPRLLALRHLFLHPEEYDVRLTPVANEPALEMIKPGRQADFSLVAEMAGLDTDTLKRLNPGYHRHATHPAGAQHLFVPRGAMEELELALAERGDRPLIRFREYTVEHGDNLGRIAERNGTRVATLREMNRMDSDLIRVGQTLRIPVTEQNEVRAIAAAEAGELDTYEVQRGDSLWTISQRSGMSISELRAANDLGRDAILQPGDTLQVARGGSTSDEGQPIDYEVRPGDSLSAIARRFEVGIGDLRRWNSLNGDSIRAGETLTVYVPRAEDAVARASDT